MRAALRNQGLLVKRVRGVDEHNETDGSETVMTAQAAVPDPAVPNPETTAQVEARIAAVKAAEDGAPAHSQAAVTKAAAIATDSELGTAGPNPQPHPADKTGETVQDGALITRSGTFANA